MSTISELASVQRCSKLFYQMKQSLLPSMQLRLISSPASRRPKLLPFKVSDMWQDQLRQQHWKTWQSAKISAQSLWPLLQIKARSPRRSYIPTCNSNIDHPFSEHISKREIPTFSRIQKRAIKYSSCTTSQTSSLKTSVTDAISMSNAAYTAAASTLDYRALQQLN